MMLSKQTVMQVIRLSQDCGSELWSFIDGLSDIEKHELTALAWLGGEYFLDFESALEESRLIPAMLTAGYLATKNTLRQFLLEALNKVEAAR